MDFFPSSSLLITISNPKRSIWLVFFSHPTAATPTSQAGDGVEEETARVRALKEGRFQ